MKHRWFPLPRIGGRRNFLHIYTYLIMEFKKSLQYDEAPVWILTKVLRIWVARGMNHHKLNPAK
jgi:hypothetical protein